MDPAITDDLSCWVTKAGLSGTSETELLEEFCRRGIEAGLPIDRALVVVDTLHPVHEGRVFRWNSRNGGESEVLEYGRTNQGGEVSENWRRSPFYQMLETGHSSMRRRLDESCADEFPLFRELMDQGQTDWVALIDRFTPGTEIGEMDCIYSSWTTAAPDGFGEDRIQALKRLVPSLGLSIKSASLARIAETLVETYLGRDAGRRVLSGRIERGVADRIEAALWFSDLRGYTRITGEADPGQIIPFLNDYAEAVISAVHEAGGDVLKLIGDGVLAIFNEASQAEACRCALRAEALARERIAEVNERRSAKGLPVTQAYIGLHVGEVFYGNIGSRDRLDFTVVGPAVNEASRIAAMCRSADRDVLVSDAFWAAASDEDRERLVSVGRYALRGVERPAELFTLNLWSEPDPAAS
ncbi:adenylate/guanylate cyclase domain-containing protein [uncultured Enterovirga sp.]|uniref:adenylate/guanylate cyclase domain-containing protein n=1 Tax=uncultured Enterovirga sp. TaxID=2026352 RepID=UPI0035C999AB